MHHAFKGQVYGLLFFLVWKAHHIIELKQVSDEPGISSNASKEIKIIVYLGKVLSSSFRFDLDKFIASIGCLQDNVQD